MQTEKALLQAIEMNTSQTESMLGNLESHLRKISEELTKQTALLQALLKERR